MDSLAARKALLFSAGGVRLALRASLLRLVVEAAEGADEDGGELTARGEALPSARVATLLGLPARRAPYALLVEGTPRAALRVEALHGIVDLGGAEFFQLPARTFLPSPAPFSGAIVWQGEIALELGSRGGSLDPLTSRDHTAFQAHVLDADLPVAIEVITDLVRRHEIALLKAEIVNPEIAPITLVYE